MKDTGFFVDKIVGIAGLFTRFSACLSTRFAACRSLTSLSVPWKTLLHFARIISASTISESPRIWSQP